MRERFPRRLEQGSGPTVMASPVLQASDFAAAPEAETMGLVQEYLQTVQRYKWSLLVFALAGMLLSGLFGLRTLPVYRTRLSLEIRPLNSDFLNIRSVNPTSNDGGSESDTNLQTQIKLLESETLLTATMQRLQSQAHSPTLDRMDLLSRIQRGLHLGHTQPIAYDDALIDASRSVKVKPVGVTRLVEITCDALSADLAAKFCNQLEQTYQ
ncbi:MAG: hypothetical protein INR62_06205, partial [Rhodospirillales bacterium]|nr:hypothetical protein [Acetobacter sp.]